MAGGAWPAIAAHGPGHNPSYRAKTRGTFARGTFVTGKLGGLFLARRILQDVDCFLDDRIVGRTAWRRGGFAAGAVSSTEGITACVGVTPSTGISFESGV